MIVYVNENQEIKDVNTTNLEGLTPLEISDENNPFANWSIAKICCYKVEVIDGIITMMTPYVDSRLIEHIDQLGNGVQSNSSDITDNREGLIETFDVTLVNSNELAECREAIMELYEMLGGN